MKNYIDISLIIDRSGSMSSCKDDVIGGVNEFIKGHKDANNDTKLSLITFSDNVEFVFEDKDVSEMHELNSTNYIPAGMTALYDAIGRTIDEKGKRLAAMKEDDRPACVMIVIVSDGQENQSLEYNAVRIKEMIKHQEENYKWQFVYIGANQDAFAVGNSIGLNNSINYTANNTRQVFRSMSKATVDYSADLLECKSRGVDYADFKLKSEEKEKLVKQ